MKLKKSLKNAVKELKFDKKEIIEFAAVIIILIVVVTAHVTLLKKSDPYNMNKFFPASNQYSPKLLEEYFDRMYAYEQSGTERLDQTIVIDTRSEEDYGKGHLLGAVNAQFNRDTLMEMLMHEPDDSSVFIYGYDYQLKENKEFARLLRDIRWNCAYHVTKSYDEIITQKGMEKYIDVRPHQFENFNFELDALQVEKVNKFFGYTGDDIDKSRSI